MRWARTLTLGAIAAGVLVAGCEGRKKSDPLANAPPEVVAVSSDPDNAFAEYFAVSHSSAAEILHNRADVLGDSKWTPDRMVAGQLVRERKQIERVIAASRRPRFDLVARERGTVETRHVGGSDVALPRTLLCAEARRRRVEGLADEAAECITALLRMARQVRSSDGLQPATSSCATARMACREGEQLLTAASLSDATCREMLAAIDVLLSMPVVAEADEQAREEYEAMTHTLRGFREGVAEKPSR